MSARRVWPGTHTPASLCPCRWNLYYASCPKPWHRELSTHDERNTVDLPGVPDFRAQGWGADR